MEWILTVLVNILQRSGIRTRCILESLTQAGASFEYKNEYEYDCKQMAHYVSVMMQQCALRTRRAVQDE